jgi:hypothetical protein
MYVMASETEVEVISRLTVSQSVCLGVEPTLGPDITSCRKVAVLSLWRALSDERTGLQFAVCGLQCNHPVVLVTQNP